MRLTDQSPSPICTKPPTGGQHHIPISSTLATDSRSGKCNGCLRPIWLMKVNVAATYWCTVKYVIIEEWP